MKILVVMGGVSSEKEVSIKSGENVYNKLKVLYPQTQKYVLNYLKDFYRYILENHYDFIFIVLHGKYGEDGKIQSFLESIGIPFSFSNSESSMVGMNKMLTNLLIKEFIKNYNVTNLHLPQTVYINNIEYEKYGIDIVFSKLKRNFILPPFIVKPNCSGSSVALSLVENFQKLEKAIELSFKEDSKTVIVQEYIQGREITVGVLQKGKEILPLEPCELELQNSKLFDYENKYIKKINHIIPPELPEEVILYLKNISSQIFEFMGFKDAVRIDYRIRSNANTHEIYFLEVNTIPGFTEVSLLPQEAEKTGISFENLLKIIIENNLNDKQILSNI
ncbi:MAG: D-alanine--D-alanine ligase [bacterium]|nr:D-alanine--D-alanine ligase [bacterium]